MKTPRNKIRRRRFIADTAATAATISIVPSHVLARSGKVPPSDKIVVANIGCGTQGLREMGSMLQSEYLQVAAVCDPNKFSTDYIDWSPHGIRNSIRRTLEDESWGKTHRGIAGGRDVAQAYINRYYSKTMGQTYSGCQSYEDFRDLLARESDVDVVKIMTPDHLHAAIGIAAMNAGKHVITHKPIANRMSEAKKTIDKAKSSGLKTHLLAWSEKPEYELIKRWISDGVIGQLREIHNWSYRPVWPQWTSLPKEGVPIPEGFNWDLWLGPVPHRPYHPNYTHNVFRGWYDFGGGSVADMGHYSLFPLFRVLGIETPPIAAKAYGTTSRHVVDSVCRWVDNTEAFPASCMIKLSFPAQETLPPFDLIWYDGGMKPFAPKELEAQGEDISNEGLLFVGDEGKILAGFQGAKPRILPLSRMDAYAGPKEVEPAERRPRSETWAQAIKEDRESPGSFVYAGPVTEAINLAAVALRSGKRLEYDTQAMKITNDEEANAFLTRKYRPGWEL